MVITGANTGIGKETAWDMAMRGTEGLWHFSIGLYSNCVVIYMTFHGVPFGHKQVPMQSEENVDLRATVGAFQWKA